MPRKPTPLERALGTGGFVTLRGVKYPLSKLRLRHFAEAKAFLVSCIPCPMKELLEEDEGKTFAGFPPEVQKALALKAFEIKEQRKALANTESTTFIEGAEGVLFFFWIMVRDNVPKFATFEAVLQDFPLDNPEKELTLAEAAILKNKIDEMSGLNEVLESRADQKKTERKQRTKAKAKKSKKSRT